MSVLATLIVAIYVVSCVVADHVVAIVASSRPCNIKAPDDLLDTYVSLDSVGTNSVY